MREFSDGVDGLQKTAKPTVCIVTGELVGPFKNGGIGTSMTGLAECLAAAGFPVTALYTGGMYLPEAEMRGWRDRYHAIGIELVWLREENLVHLAGPLRNYGFCAPYLVYEYLKGRRFDVVQFNDCLGDGFYALSMKRLGAAFSDTLMCLALHSPSQWVFELNGTLPSHLHCSAFNYAERLSTRCADLVWSPSRYLIDWVRSKGFALPSATYVQQYAIPTRAFFGEAKTASAAAAPSGGRVRPAEIVFFGRLEERKGLRLFCRVLTDLSELLAKEGVAVTFLGKPGEVGEMNAMAFLEEQSAGWSFPWRAETDLGRQEALDYIQARSALAVMASPADNSPCTVYEALSFGLPFIAARTGGIPELICEEDRDAVLFDNDRASLAARLRQVLRDGVPRARPTHTQEAARRRWAGALGGWRDLLPHTEAREPERRLTVVIDGGRGAELDASLASLSGLGSVDRIVVLDRSGAAKSPFADPRVTVFEPGQDEPSMLLQGLDDGPRAVLFLRTGAQVVGEALAEFLRALSLPAVDGLLPAAEIGSGPARLVAPALGGSVAFSFYEGAAHTGGMVVKADRLAGVVDAQALPLEAEFLGLTDLAIIKGLEIWPYAEPALRQAPGYGDDLKRRRTRGRIEAYGGAEANERFYIEAVGYGGLRQEVQAANFQRSLRNRLSRMGLGWSVRLGLKIVPPWLVRAVMRRLSA